MNPYAKIRFSMSKNEAAMQKTMITKKMEKIRVNNSAKKWKIKILKKRPRDIHQMNHYAKIGFSMSKNEAAMQKTAITKKTEEKTPK